MVDMPHVVVVGAGLGGLRAADALRGSGFDVTVIGEEPHPPYNRPPLSKESLMGGIDIDGLLFRRKHEDITWHLDAPATALDLAARTVTAGATYAFDGLVIATGIHSRHLPVPGPRPFTLRTVDDALALRQRLTPGTRLLVVGAGFIGCEVAATARQLGCEVTITAYDREPMVAALGPELGAAMRRHHEQHGVTFCLGVGVSEFHEDGVTLADGTRLRADVVLEAVGSVPSIEWLDGNGLDLSDGVLADNLLRVVGTDVPVVAVGDVVRFPNPRFDDIPRRIEHWNMPTETAKRAALTLTSLVRGEQPRGDFRPMPAFWSDQYDLSLQAFGLSAAGQAHLVDGSWDGDAIVEYRHEGELMGVVGVNRTTDLMHYRQEIGHAS